MSTRPKQQKSIKRDRRYHASECSEKTDLQEKKITHDAPIAVKDETKQCQEYKIQTPFIPERHIFPTEKQYSLYPNMINPLPPSQNFPNPFPSTSKYASNEPSRKQAGSQSGKNIPPSTRLPLSSKLQLTFGGDNIIPLGKSSGSKNREIAIQESLNLHIQNFNLNNY